jgi:hypothetical protein
MLHACSHGPPLRRVGLGACLVCFLGDEVQPQYAWDMHVGACTYTVPCLVLHLFVIHTMHAWGGLCIMLMVCAVSVTGAGVY